MSRKLFLFTARFCAAEGIADQEVSNEYWCSGDLLGVMSLKDSVVGMVCARVGRGGNRSNILPRGPLTRGRRWRRCGRSIDGDDPGRPWWCGHNVFVLHSWLHSEGLNHSSALFPTNSAHCIPRGRIRNCNADNGSSCFCSVPFRGGWEQILRHDDGARCDQSRAIIAFTTGPDTEDFPHFAGRIVNMLCQVSHRPTSNNFNQPGLLMDNLSRGTTRDWFSLSASQD
jgi:hypothetical protein